MPFLARILILAALAAFMTGPASAVQPTGSAGWTTEGWTNFDGALYAGPGARYGQIDSVQGGKRVRVDQCSKRWCEIHASGVHGWLSQDNVSFGQHPDGWLKGPKFPTQRGGPGLVCFYSGANFTGSAFCRGTGYVANDLKLLGLDNSVSSVEVGAGVSALVCRDRHFHSYCQVVDVSKGRLDGLLDNGISSIQVY